MGAVGDEEAIARAVSQHLAGEEERTGTRFLVAREIELQRLVVESLLLLVDLDEIGDRLVDRLVQSLARAVCDEIALGVDEPDRRPRLTLVRLPEFPLGIVDDGMADLVA